MTGNNGPTRKRAKKSIWPLVIGLAVVAALAGAAVVFLGGGPEGQSSSEPAARPSGDGASDGGAEPGPPSLGDENAPVVMVEYADFQCPFCGKFARETEPKLVDKYVKAGTLRIEWRDFPYLGQESVNAALAARAAQAQGKFWEYHDILYENQKSTNSGAFSDENLAKFARAAGLDVDRFKKDLTSGKYEKAVARDFQEGQQRGITGTPTFFINETVVVGAQPIEAFERAIESAAREAEGD